MAKGTAAKHNSQVQYQIVQNVIGMSWPTYGIGLERVKGIDIGGGGGPLGDMRLPQLSCVI